MKHAFFKILVLLTSILPTIGFGDVRTEFEIKTYASDAFFTTRQMPNTLFFTGKIKKNQYDEFRRAVVDNNITQVVLSSPGGNVYEGLKIAGMIFDREINTYIPAEEKCFSACSFLFFAGNERHVDGELGVHQFSYGKLSDDDAKIGEISVDSQLTMADIIQYLNEFKTPPKVFEWMLRTPPEDMYILSKYDLDQIDNENITTAFSEEIMKVNNFGAILDAGLAEEECDSTPGSCNDVQICDRATFGPYEKSWRTSPASKKFIDEAKSRNLSCDVPAPLCDDDITVCTNVEICERATFLMDNKILWHSGDDKLLFVQAAKNRGISCGVKLPTCAEDALLCNPAKLCEKATIQTLDGYAWSENEDARQFVLRAKKERISCGVTTANRSEALGTYLCPVSPRLDLKKDLGIDPAECDRNLDKVKYVAIVDDKLYLPETCFKGIQLYRDELTDERINFTSSNPRMNLSLVPFGTYGELRLDLFDGTTKLNRNPERSPYQLEITALNTCEDIDDDDLKQSHPMHQYEIMKIVFESFSDVERGLLQSKLAQLDYYKTNIDGLWGKQTATALQNYATRTNRKETKFNSYSQNQMIESLLKLYLAPPIVQIQKMLNDRGCSAGVADGVWGRNTQSAAVRFAKIINYDLNKLRSNAFLSAMISNSKKRCKSSVTSQYFPADELEGNWNTISNCNNGVTINGYLKARSRGLHQGFTFSTYDFVYTNDRGQRANGRGFFYTNKNNSKITATLQFEGVNQEIELDLRYKSGMVKGSDTTGCEIIAQRALQ